MESVANVPSLPIRHESLGANARNPWENALYQVYYLQMATVPLTRMAVISQTQVESPLIRTGKMLRLEGIRAAARHIVRTQGISGLYRGIWPGLPAGIIGRAAFVDSVEKSFKHRLERKQEQPEVWPKIHPVAQASQYIGICVTGQLMTSALIHPLYLSHIVQASDLHPGWSPSLANTGTRNLAQTLRQVLRNTYQEGGLMALWRGYAPLSVATLLFWPVYFFSELSLQTPVAGRPGFEDTDPRRCSNSFVESELIPILSLVNAIAVAHPFDTMCKRMMVDSSMTHLYNRAIKQLDGQRAHPKSILHNPETGRTRSLFRQRYTTFRQCLSHIWRTEGLRGLYTGLPINLVRGAAVYSLVSLCDYQEDLATLDEHGWGIVDDST